MATNIKIKDQISKIKDQRSKVKGQNQQTGIGSVTQGSAILCFTSKFLPHAKIYKKYLIPASISRFIGIRNFINPNSLSVNIYEIRKRMICSVTRVESDLDVSRRSIGMRSRFHCLDVQCFIHQMK
jgi:hypothetical protein